MLQVKGLRSINEGYHPKMNETPHTRLRVWDSEGRSSLGGSLDSVSLLRKIKSIEPAYSSDGGELDLNKCRVLRVAVLTLNPKP